MAGDAGGGTSGCARLRLGCLAGDAGGSSPAGTRLRFGCLAGDAGGNSSAGARLRFDRLAPVLPLLAARSAEFLACSIERACFSFLALFFARPVPTACVAGAVCFGRVLRFLDSGCPRAADAPAAAASFRALLARCASANRLGLRNARTARFPPAPVAAGSAAAGSGGREASAPGTAPASVFGAVPAGATSRISSGASRSCQSLQHVLQSLSRQTLHINAVYLIGLPRP